MNQFLKGFNVLRHKIKFTNQQRGWQHLPNRNADTIMCLELNAQQRASIQSLNMEEQHFYSQITEVINLLLRTSPDTFGGSSFLLAESTIVVTSTFSSTSLFITTDQFSIHTNFSSNL